MAPTNGQISNDPVLQRFRQALAETYGDRVERAVLFGSRAPGEARQDSDYDVAVFLHDLVDRLDQMDRLADIGTRLLGEQGQWVHALLFQTRSYMDRTPIMHEIRNDGLDLWSRRPVLS